MYEFTEDMDGVLSNLVDVYNKKKQEKAMVVIKKAIEDNNSHVHNIISWALMKLSRDAGTKYSDELVDEFDLKELYGICKIGDKKDG